MAENRSCQRSSPLGKYAKLCEVVKTQKRKVQHILKQMGVKVQRFKQIASEVFKVIPYRKLQALGAPPVLSFDRVDWTKASPNCLCTAKTVPKSDEKREKERKRERARERASDFENLPTLGMGLQKAPSFWQPPKHG